MGLGAIRARARLASLPSRLASLASRLAWTTEGSTASTVFGE
jgi:BMFP domain-containing protein YqiC